MRCFDQKAIESVIPFRKEGYLEEIERCKLPQSHDGTICLDNAEVERIQKTYRTEQHTPHVQIIPPPVPSNMPSAIQMAKNLATAVTEEAQAVLHGEEPVTQEEVDRRIGICNGCPNFTKNNTSLPEHVRKQERCTLCGCFMAYKSRLRSQHCPDGKW